MNVSDLAAHDLVRVEFAKNKARSVPLVAGVYALTNFSGCILYIGLSKNLQRRMLEHLSNAHKLSLSPEGRAYWFFYREGPEQKLKPDERGWMHQYQLHEGRLPYFNKIEAPC